MNGRRPPADLDLRPWLDMASHQADIVAVGFQEVVPLNAGNVVMGTQHSARCLHVVPLLLIICRLVMSLACMREAMHIGHNHALQRHGDPFGQARGEARAGASSRMPS